MAREMERHGCGHIQLTKRQLRVAKLKLLSEPNNNSPSGASDGQAPGNVILPGLAHLVGEQCMSREIETWMRGHIQL
jgi:hypothetical protein